MNAPNEATRPRSVRCAGQPSHHSGAVLIIGLIILVVMTILGIGSMRTSALEELMARQSKEQSGAFHAAEAGMQAALSYLAGLRVPSVVNAQGDAFVWPACQVKDTDHTRCSMTNFDPCCFAQTVIAAWDAYDPMVTGQVLAGKPMTALSGQGLNTIAAEYQPHFIIVERYTPPLDPTAPPGFRYYTVVAIGFDAGTNSRSILQSTITKYYP